MKKNKKFFLVILLVLNAIVLLGQIWPAGAPPFSRLINIGTLILNVMMFFTLIGKR